MAGTSEPKKGVDIYSDISYQLLSSFEWRLNYGVEDSNFSGVG